MNNQERYKQAVRQLADCGYEVLPDEQGYIVRHLTDHGDVSCARNINEVIELAELMVWAEEQRRSIKAKLNHGPPAQ